MRKLLILALFLPCLAWGINYQDNLSGKRLILEGTSCTGVSFSKNSKDAYMYGEGACAKESTLAFRVRWLDSNTFILIEKNQSNETSPPRTFLYRVQSINGKRVKLTEIWTGWSDFKDETLTYILK